VKRSLVIQHSSAEFLGPLEHELESRDIGFAYRRPFTGDAPAGLPGQFDALWLLGGAHAVTDREHCPWIDDELRLVAAFRRARRPVVGIGFGGLLIALACGGVPRDEADHVGFWTQARATAAGRDDPVAAAVDGRTVLVLAKGHVDCPPGTIPLACDERGDWVVLRPDPFTYALRFRPDVKPGTLEDMVMDPERETPEGMDRLIREARQAWPRTQETNARVCAGLVAALDLMTERRKSPVVMLKTVGRAPDQDGGAG
jgi:GMP synthase-like glutamine amidotransferase